AASTVAKSGAVKLIEIALAKGISDSDQNPATMEMKLMAERSVNIQIRPVFRMPSPFRTSQGSMKNRPKKFRQNVTTKGCIPRSLKWRTWALRVAKHRLAQSTSSTAHSGCTVPASGRPAEAEKGLTEGLNV